jgi:hypothetical protein
LNPLLGIIFGTGIYVLGTEKLESRCRLALIDRIRFWDGAQPVLRLGCRLVVVVVVVVIDVWTV